MSTLYTAASGLLAHQRKLDVVANNLANLNTTSFKAQKILFSDLLYNTFQPAQGSEDPTAGGSNPKQIGFGVDVSQITRNFAQGVLSNTGEQFDFAIQGEGYFVVDDIGEVPKFTRDGAFSLDRNGFLVDPATGGLVQRFGAVGEGSATEPGFQTPGESRIYVPLGASVAGKETTISSFIGNLPATAIPPLEEVLTTASPFMVGGAPADLTTLLNDLDSNLVDYQVGDTIEILGTNADGSSFTGSMAVGPATTLGDIVTAVNGTALDATMDIAPDGNLVLTANDTGVAMLSLNLSDGATNVGSTDLLSTPFVVQTEGKEGDKFQSTIQVFDVRGEPHQIQVTFEKMDANNWNAYFSTGEPGITFTDGLIENITFEEDGTFRTVNGTGTGDINIEMQIDGLIDDQIITLSMDDLTHMATSFSSTFDQNGFPPGEIISIGVAGGGTLEGIASNGRRIMIAQLALATFNNVRGLEAQGGNYFVESSNSGVAKIGAAQSNGSGAILSGQLETSNVDVALEFTQLIVAQRGFSANARTVTVATEVLEELTNIIR